VLLFAQKIGVVVRFFWGDYGVILGGTKNIFLPFFKLKFRKLI